MKKELTYDHHNYIWEVKEAIKARVAKTELSLRKLESETKDDIWSDYNERKIFELVERKEQLLFMLRQL